MNACTLLLGLAVGQALPAPTPLQPEPGAPVVVPAAPSYPVIPAPIRPITLEEFAATFQPLPGTYEVTFIHPGKKCPVTVCFTLPPGCPKVRLTKRQIEFDYGRCDVTIRFRICGKVSVTTH